jgi:hypothetical protein
VKYDSAVILFLDILLPMKKKVVAWYLQMMKYVMIIKKDNLSDIHDWIRDLNIQLRCIFISTKIL